MTKKARIKIGIVIIITCVMCFSDWGFAAAEEAGEMGIIAWTCNLIVSVLGWIWVAFANLAGKFLTNNWVYGQALGLDALLWQYRNIVKNMANFCLGFYLMYVIFNGLIGQYKGKENIVKNLGKVLKWILVAGIGIQASWFLTSVVIDLSTITLTAVGTLPAYVVSKSETVKEGIDASMREFGNGTIDSGKIQDLFPKDGATNSLTKVTEIPLSKPITDKELADSLLPNKDDLSGPLYYMGFSILRTWELNSVKSYEGPAGAKQTILNLIIQGGTTIVYSIEMGIFCVIALMRILYLWMFIVLSPFAILLTCVKKAGGDDILKKGFLPDLMKQINLKTFLAKVFQPAIIVLGISLSMIFVTLMSRVVNNDPNRNMEDEDIGGAKVTSLKDETEATNDDKTYTTTIEGNLVKLSITKAGKGILDFMMSIITVVLVYFIINMSIKAGDMIFDADGQDLLSQKIKGVTEGVESVITSVPIVPVAGYDEEGVPTTHHLSVGKIFGLPTTNGSRKSLLAEGIDEKIIGKIKDRYTEQDRSVDALLGIKKGYLTSEQERTIANAGNNEFGIAKLIAKKSAIEAIGKTEEGAGLTLNSRNSNGFWIQEFTKWLEGMKGKTVTGTNYNTVWDNMIKRWNDDNKDNKTLEKMFKENNSGQEQSVKAYADLFGLSLDRYDWEHLIEADISRK